MSFNSYFTMYTKIRCIIVLNVKAKTIKLKKGNIREYLYDSGVGKCFFLDMTKNNHHKGKIAKLGFIRIKIFIFKKWC